MGEKIDLGDVGSHGGDRVLTVGCCGLLWEVSKRGRRQVQSVVVSSNMPLHVLSLTIDESAETGGAGTVCTAPLAPLVGDSVAL